MNTIWCETDFWNEKPASQINKTIDKLKAFENDQSKLLHVHFVFPCQNEILKWSIILWI